MKLKGPEQFLGRHDGVCQSDEVQFRTGNAGRTENPPSYYKNIPKTPFINVSCVCIRERLIILSFFISFSFIIPSASDS